MEDLLGLNLSTMDNNDLQKNAKAMQDALRNMVDEGEIEKLKKENSYLKARVRQMKISADESNQKYEELRRSFIEQNDQYKRREIIEICGISDDVSEENLEFKVLKILNSVTKRKENPIVSKDIHACHRLKREKGEESARVIVRMVNRKDTSDILKCLNKGSV